MKIFKHQKNMKFFLFASLIFLFVNANAQSANGYDISLDGHWVGSNSDAAFQSHSIHAKLLSSPINQGKDGVISVNGMYSFVNFTFENNKELFKDLDYFHSIGFALSYSRGLKNTNWYLTGMVIPQLNSNFTDGIKGGDFYLNAVLLATHMIRKDARLTIGLTYSSTLGFPAPIPIISYWKAWNDQWEMNLGFPKMYLTHHFNKKSSIMTLLELKGYNGNISSGFNDPLFEKNRAAQRVSYRDILTGLEYSYKLNNILLNFDASYAINRSLKLQNTDNETAYKFDVSNGWNVGIGIAFNLHNKK